MPCAVAGETERKEILVKVQSYIIKFVILKNRSNICINKPLYNALHQNKPHFVDSVIFVALPASYKHTVIIAGESYTADDGCNSCSCTRDQDTNGLVAMCTYMLCPDQPPNLCVANGVTYQEGMSMNLLLYFARYTWWRHIESDKTTSIYNVSTRVLSKK